MFRRIMRNIQKNESDVKMVAIIVLFIALIVCVAIICESRPVENNKEVVHFVEIQDTVYVKSTVYDTVKIFVRDTLYIPADRKLYSKHKAVEHFNGVWISRPLCDIYTDAVTGYSWINAGTDSVLVATDKNIADCIRKKQKNE